MKRTVWLRVCALFIMIGIFACTMTGCSGGDPSAAEQRLKDFVLKCNKLDIDGILRCIDPAVAEPIALAISGIELVGKWGGTTVDKYEIYEKVSSAILNEEGLDAQEFLESIQVDIVETKVHGSYADIYANITYAIADIKFTKEGIVYMVEQADAWYVSSLEFVPF